MLRVLGPRLHGARALLAFSLAVWPCACASAPAPVGSAASPRAQAEPAERVQGVEGIDVAELTDDEQGIWVELINSELSPCGDPVSVGRCANQSGGCARCGGAARYLERMIMEGYGADEVRARYRNRYGPEGVVEIDLEDRPTRGPADAQITLVEFSDFECPHCGRAHPLLVGLLRAHPEQVRMVFKHFPLPGHFHALGAAKAAEAAHAQGKFWPMHDLLFENQRALGDEQLREYAEQIGLDLARFDADREAAATLARIEADVDEGAKLGVQGTPTIFVNGRRFEDPPTSLDDYVAEELGP